jgi:hypothetical protein
MRKWLVEWWEDNARLVGCLFSIAVSALGWWGLVAAIRAVWR